MSSDRVISVPFSSRDITVILHCMQKEINNTRKRKMWPGERAMWIDELGQVMRWITEHDPSLNPADTNGA